MTSNSITIIVFILIACGITGGLAHYFKEEKRPPFHRRFLFHSILTGVVSAFTVPLFLRMASSEIIGKSVIRESEYFVLAGFALIAAYFSQRFLNSISEHVFRELDTVKQEVKNNEDKVDGLIDIQSDTELPKGSSPPLPDTLNFPSGNENFERIVHAMGPGHVPFRTISGLSGDSGLDPEQISGMLEQMRGENLVRSFRILNDKEVYSLTPRGRNFFQSGNPTGTNL